MHQFLSQCYQVPTITSFLTSGMSLVLFGRFVLPVSIKRWLTTLNAVRIKTT